MGQILGKACIKPAAVPFANLPKSVIVSIRQCVYEVAEGYGLSKNDLRTIIRLSLIEYLRLSETNLGERSDALFDLLNAGSSPDSKEELIDSFEFLVAMCLVSGMEREEKISFMFDVFDVRESGKLNINEATLAFRSSVAGTSKIATTITDDVNVIDAVALDAFELNIPDTLKYSHAMTAEDLSKNEFIDYLFNCSETSSFLDYFDDILVEVKLKSSVDLALARPLRFYVPERVKPSPNQPWKEHLRLLQPGDIDDELAHSPPTSGLDLDWIYGRNVQTPALLCSNGDILYAAGSIVVKLSTNMEGKEAQEYFLGHQGHVTSIDVFQMTVDDLVASANIGIGSKICVWSSSNLKPIVTIPVRHESGVSQVKFSPSGQLLLALGNNDNNTISVYDWRKSKVPVFTSKLSGTDIYDCSFLCSDNSIAVCTREAVVFYTRREPSMPYLRSRGVFDRLSTREVMTSIAAVGDSVITLSSSGLIWIWEGRVCTKLVNISSVSRLHAPRRNSSGIKLCVSTFGHSIHLLGSSFESLHEYVPNKKCIDNYKWTSICVHPDSERVLVCKETGGLFQMSALDKINANVLVNGHPEVRGISIKNDTTVITVGSTSIKVWDPKQHSVLRQTSFESKLSCVSCNPKVDQIAVGFQGPRSISDKSFVILKGDDLTIIHHGCNSQETLTVCRFSSDGTLLAFGSADATIYVYQLNGQGTPLLLSMCRGHTSPVTCLDFGRDARLNFIRSNSESGEAMSWTTGGKLCTPASTREAVWETCTCIYTAALERVHSFSDAIGSKITACCPLGGDKSTIVGDCNGNIRVFDDLVRDPPLKYSGHSGTVQSIVVSVDNTLVHTIGTTDSCIFQWRRTALAWDQGLPIASRGGVKLPSGRPLVSEVNTDSMIMQLDSLDFTHDGRKDTVANPMHWTRSIVAPSTFSPSESDLPEVTLSLERIHGYSGNGIKHSLHALDDGSVVYVVGTFLARLNAEQKSQHFCHLNANDGVFCLSVHKGRSICAIGLHAAISIVDLNQMKALSTLDNISGAVACLAFDHSGTYLVSVANIGEIAVHDWKNDMIVASSQTYGYETLDVKFLKGSSDHMIECGTCFVRFWTIHNCSLQFQEVAMSAVSYSCIGWNGDNVIVATSSGHIVPFTGITPEKRIKGHDSAVTNLVSAKDGLISSCSDRIKLWDFSMRCMLSINTKDVGVQHLISSISSIDDVIFVGSSGSEIWQLDVTNVNGVTGNLLVSSHASSQMGLTTNGGLFATTGDDCTLRLWNVFDHNETKSFDLTMPSRTCPAFSPDGNMIAVGFGKPEKENARIIDGKWIIINIKGGSFEIIAERRDVKRYITDMKWHSKGDRIAVGSADHKICVYAVNFVVLKADIRLLSTIDPASTPMHIDFSVDGKYLRTNTENHELFFFEAGSGIPIQESSRLKDFEWDTETCIFTWSVQSVWKKDSGAGAVKIISLDCTTQERYPTIAASDQIGRIMLFEYPATTSDAQYISYPAHIGPCKVRWLPGYLASIGTRDNAILIWRQEVVSEGRIIDRRVSLDQPQPSRASSVNSDKLICNSAMYDQIGERIVYPTSGNVHVFDKTTNHVEVFHMHDSTVLAICASKSIIATADENTIRIWDPQTNTEIVMLTNKSQQHISSISFSPDGRSLVAVSLGGLFVWMAQSGDWSASKLAYQTLSGRNKVHFALFDVGKTNFIVSGGRKHVNFWTERNATLTVRKGLLSETCINDTFTCGVSVNEKMLITGSKSGSLVFWEENVIVKGVPAHNGSVTSLRACPEGFISGCAHGVVILWSIGAVKHEKVASYNIASSPIGSIDMIAHSHRSKTTKILIRTEAGDIYEVSCVTGKVFLLRTLVDSEAVIYVEPNPIGQPVDNNSS